MKKTYLFLTVLLVSVLALNTTETFAQCPKSIYQTANVGTPPCGGAFAQTSLGSGTYVTMSVTAGALYCISTCGTSFDTQITGYNGGTSIFYNNDNGFDCNPSTNASIQWTATFTGTIDVMVNANNCQGYTGGGSANSAILKYKQCAPTITSSGADLCPGQCVALTADQPGGTWSISPNNGSLSGTNFCPNAIGVYTISYTIAACTSTQIINVNAPSVAATSIIAVPASVCPGGSSVLSVSGGSLGVGSSWEWYASSCASAPIGSGSTITVTPSSTTTYYVRAIGGCGPTACTSVTVPFNVLSTDPTSVTATNTTLCQGTATTLTVNGGSLGTSSSWYWYSGGCGGILVGSGPSITINPLSSTVYYVRAEGPCNQTACVSIPINVVPAPQAGFGFITTPSACGASDGCIQIVANGGTPPYSYTVNGNPSTATVCNLPAGPYIIDVGDASGCHDITSVSLNDPGASPAFLTSSDQDNIICEGECVTFTATGSYLYSYYVNGTFVTNSNPWTTCSLQDGDIVHVIALDFNFCSYTTLGITMTVHPNPVVVVVPANPTGCGLCDGSVTANVSGGQPNYTYAWSPNTSETTGLALNLCAGPYFVDVTDQFGCIGTATAALSDPGAAPVTLTSSDVDSMICAGENIDFTASGSVDYTFFSSVASPPVVLGPSTTAIYSTTGLVNNEVIIATGKDANGCTATSNYITTTVNPGPTVTLVSSDDNDSTCVGDMVTFTGTGALFYQFYVNGNSQGAPGTLNVLQIVPNDGDVICVEGTDGNHCIVMSNCITMTVTAPPTVSITTQQDPSSCGANDGLVVVDAQGGVPGYAYEWNGGSLGTSPAVSNLYAGPYFVEVTDAAGCTASLTATLSDVGSSPAFITSSDNDNIICEGEAVTFTGSGATTYVFYIDGVVVSTSNPFTTTTLLDGQGVAVVGLDTLLCAATSSVIVHTVHEAPHTVITATSHPTACGLSDGFIHTNTVGGLVGLGYTYSWSSPSPGPNSPDNDNIPAGGYTLIVTDGNGCTDQVSASLSDVGAPLITMTSSDDDNFICQGDTVTFVGTGASIINFYVNNPPPIPGTPDTYSTWLLADNDVVYATGTDVNGCTGTSQSITFNVTTVVQPTLSAFADVCENVDQIMLSGGSPSGGTFSADYGNPPTVITSDLFFPFGIGAGAHTITYTYDNGNGCNSTATGTINVLPSPTVDLGPDIVICDSVTISTNPSNFVDYVWFPYGQTGVSSISAYISANYSVEVTDLAGCKGTDEVLAVINHAPELHIGTSPVDAPTEICIGDTVTICVQGLWANVHWNTGSTTNCIDVYQTGNYSVSAIDFNGCTDSIYEGQGIVVTVHNPQPEIVVLCDEFMTSEYSTYQWYWQGQPLATGNDTSRTFHNAESGNYYVVVTDEWGCVDTSSVVEHTCCCVGIDEASIAYNLDIYPNPTNGVFTMNGSFEQAIDMRLELTDVLGQLIIPVEDVKNSSFVRRDYNLNHLANGVYIFTIRTAGENIVRRIVKN